MITKHTQLAAGYIAGLPDPTGDETQVCDRNENTSAVPATSAEDSIWIYSGKKFHNLKLNEIYAVEGLKDYVKVHYSEGIMLVKGNLGSIARKLPSPQFIRIHRSYIVNRAAIRVIDGNMIRMPNGAHYTIPSYKSREGIINQLLGRQRRI